MKILWLVRHAKSSWRDASLPDRDRPLNRRGERNAPTMGRRLARSGDRPQVILSSPALRALTTGQILARALGIKRTRLQADERLYHTSVPTLLRRLRALPDDLERVMLVGHNPGLLRLSRHWAPQITRLPTCAVVRLTFASDRWHKLADSVATDVRFDTPKRRHD